MFYNMVLCNCYVISMLCCCFVGLALLGKQSMKNKCRYYLVEKAESVYFGNYLRKKIVIQKSSQI